jgi:hypothetical protein
LSGLAYTMEPSPSSTGALPADWQATGVDHSAAPPGTLKAWRAPLAVEAAYSAVADTAGADEKPAPPSAAPGTPLAASTGTRPPAGATAYSVEPSGETAGRVAATDTPAAVVHRAAPAAALTAKRAPLAATPTNAAAAPTTPAADDTPGATHARRPEAVSMPVRLVMIPWLRRFPSLSYS